MKSRITIDLDEDNMPCIKIKHEPSDDVRDGMVKRFLEHVGSAAEVKFRYEQHEQWQNNSRAVLRPFEPTKIDNK